MRTQVRKSWLWAIGIIVLLAAFALVSKPVSADIIGDLEITPTVNGETLTDDDFKFDAQFNLLTIKSSKKMTIKNTDPKTPSKISTFIASDITANLTLAGVNISDSDDEFCALTVLPKTKDTDTDTTLNLTLAEGSVNTLQSGQNRAGLEVTAGAALVIDGKGSLTAGSNGYGAGIGGSYNNEGQTGQSVGTITINSGNIVAYSSVNMYGYGAGIGGGRGGAGGTIAINSGNIMANSSVKWPGHGAGIGGGYGANGGTITINGGTIEACSSSDDSGHGAGIGGGNDGDGGHITIKGGNIEACSTLTSSVSSFGAGIGGGIGGDGGSIEITGGRVVAESDYGDGIGLGDSGSPENTTIAYKGGSVDAKSRDAKALSVSPTLPDAGQYLWKVDAKSDALYKLGSNIPYNWAENDKAKFTAFRDPLGDIPVIQTQPAGFTCLQDEGDKTLEVTLEKSIENATYQWIVDKGDGKGFVAIVGATQSTYTVPTDTVSTWHYRVNITTTGSLPVFIQSDTATVTVNPHPQPNYETTITLVDEANTPVPDAQVSLSENETVIREGKTDQDGKETFSGLAAGLYTVKFAKDGYQSVDTDISVYNANVLIYLSMQTTAPGPSVSGRVTYLAENQEITPVNGAVVSIGAIVNTSTDENGCYMVSNLPSGNYGVMAKHPIHGTTTVLLDHFNSNSIVDLQLQSGESTSISLSGQVLGKEMRPLAGVKVALSYEEFSSPIMTVTTNNQGDYRFDGLEDGKPIFLTVSQEGYENYSAQTYGAGNSVVHNIELTYNRYPITGRITGDLNRPLPGAEVELLDANSFSIAKVNTDAKGGFNLEDIPNGSYTLAANCEGYQEGRVAVVVAGNQVSTALQLTKAPEPDTYSFTGVIRNSAGGEPVSSADVTLNRETTIGWLFKTVSAADGQTVQTDANGYYAFTNVEAGSYTITVGAEGYERTTSEVFEVPGTLSFDLALTKKADPTPQPDPTPDPKPSPSPTVKVGRSNNTGDDSPIAFLLVASAVALGGIWILAKRRKMMR